MLFDANENGLQFHGSADNTSYTFCGRMKGKKYYGMNIRCNLK